MQLVAGESCPVLNTSASVARFGNRLPDSAPISSYNDVSPFDVLVGRPCQGSLFSDRVGARFDSQGDDHAHRKGALIPTGISAHFTRPAGVRSRGPVAAPGWLRAVAEAYRGLVHRGVSDALTARPQGNNTLRGWGRLQSVHCVTVLYLRRKTVDHGGRHNRQRSHGGD